MGKASKTPVRVKVWVTGQPRRLPNFLSKLLLVGMMSGAIATTVGGIWLALRLIVDPGSVYWVHRMIPGWNLPALTARIVQTQTEIEAEAASAGLWVGKPIYFSTYAGLSKNSAAFHEFLLPFYSARSDCQTVLSVAATAQQCQLAELRVYRPQTSALSLPGKAPTWELVDRLAVTGPEELMAIAPLVNADIVSSGSSQRLPLTAVSFIDGNPPLPGVWLHVSGEWQRGSSHALYGQVIHYDPTHSQMQSLLMWTSPAEQFPLWQQVTGGDAAELVIDQTIGLEPQFQVYQFAVLSTPGKPVQVKAIDLREAMLDNRTYANGLLMARHGLWSSALQLLQQSKKASPHWSTTAQAQMDLIALHANVTQAQAKRDWPNPQQQIIALLIDGQWAKALSVLRTAHANGYTTSSLLTDQSDRLWNRVEAAVRVNPRPDVLNWGVLLTALRQDRSAALAWLQKQTSGDRHAEQILSLLDPLSITTVAASPPVPSPPTPLASTVPVSTASSTIASSSSRIIGSATAPTRIDLTHWLPPDSAEPLTLSSNQTWYEIQVIGFQDGLHWQQWALPDLASDEDTPEIAQMLWQRLGLSQNVPLQLITWTLAGQPEVRQATAKAVRIADGTVWLLAAGEPDAALASDTPVLVMTLDTLSWMEPLSTMTLTTLNQQPQWAESLVPNLWQALQQSPDLLPASITNSTDLLQAFGGWSVQLMELTGDNQPEAVLTLQADLSPTKAVAQTLILSSNKGLLYSDLPYMGRSLKAIADLGSGNLPALIISNTKSYQIQQWSEPDQRFE